MRTIIALAALAAAAPAHAQWSVANTQHFQIYSEQSPKALKGFAEELERYDQAVRLVRGMHDQPPSIGNRVTIFDVTPQTISALARDPSGFIRGFYHADIAGSAAFVTRNTQMSFEKHTEQLGPKIDQYEMRPDTVLLHEYAHHLMFQDLTTPYPQWLVEGFAEFMSGASFEKDGSVGLGLPAMHRYLGLAYDDQLSLESLFAGNFDKLTEEETESVYGQGWLLTHYLTFEPSRKGQLDAYVAAISRGVDPVVAAKQTFGDLDVLKHDLKSYFAHAQLKLSHLEIPGSDLKPVSVQISPVTAGGTAILPVLMQLNSGEREDYKALAATAEGIEPRFAGDPLVETTLAQTELEAKNFKAAQAAAERALAADPNSTSAMVLEGRAKIEQLAAAGGPAASFDEARSWYLKANKLDPEDPEPLYRYYEAFAKQGVAPSRNAIAALHYASDLAPQDLGVRVESASVYLTEGKLKEARTALVPVAFDPHGDKESATAREMIKDIDAGNAAAALAAAAAKPVQAKGS